jgi:hypothetical protein
MSEGVNESPRAMHPGFMAPQSRSFIDGERALLAMYVRAAVSKVVPVSSKKYRNWTEYVVVSSIVFNHP